LKRVKEEIHLIRLVSIAIEILDTYARSTSPNMASPDSYYDEDLSTLSNIRVNNRRSKQKLKTRISDDTNTLDILLRDSPTKTKHPSPLRKSYVPGSSRTPSSEEHYDIDSRILDKENSVYSDKKSFQKNLEANELKREKILKSLESPIYRSRSTNRHTDIPEDTFHRSSLKSNIPDLKPTRHRFSTQRPFISADATTTTTTTTRGRREMDTVLKEVNQDQNFQKLLSKYNLKNDEDAHSEQSRVRDLQRKISLLELNLDELKLKSGSQSKVNHELLKKKNELIKQVDELTQYVDFLELNFDKVYKKMGRYKSDNYQLNRVNNELSKLNDKYRDLLKNKTIDVGEDIRHLKSMHNDGQTTNLLNMNFQ
jgi:hypothetical protein